MSRKRRCDAGGPPCERPDDAGAEVRRAVGVEDSTDSSALPVLGGARTLGSGDDDMSTTVEPRRNVLANRRIGTTLGSRGHSSCGLSNESN